MAQEKFKLKLNTIFSVDVGRRHIHKFIILKAVACAVGKAFLAKRATCHTFRHSFATQFLEGGYDSGSGNDVGIDQNESRALSAIWTWLTD